MTSKEKVDRIKNDYYSKRYSKNKLLNIIKKDLERLEAIDNAKPSEALEDLKELKDAFLTIKQEWLEDSNVKLTEWQKNVFDSLEKDLERLEQIDNANPSEALKCLIGLEKEIMQRDGYITNFLKIKFDNIKQALLKAQEQEKENAYLKEVIRRQNEILEILKKAYTNHIWSLYADTYELASSGFYRKIEITQEQSHLFEEWLGNEKL